MSDFEWSGEYILDKKSKPFVKPFKFSPFISAGVIEIDDLKKFVEQMASEGAKSVKFTGETVFVWDQPETEGGPEGLNERVPYQPNEFKFGGVRPVKLCSAESFCHRFQQPVLDLALLLDKKFHHIPLEMKLVIGISGCQRSCSEPITKDIGVIARPDGYEIIVGGSAGLKPQLGVRLAVVDSADDVIEVIERSIEYFRKNGKKGQRLGRVIERLGMEEFREDTLDEKYLNQAPREYDSGNSARPEDMATEC